MQFPTNVMKTENFYSFTSKPLVMLHIIFCCTAFLYIYLYIYIKGEGKINKEKCNQMHKDNKVAQEPPTPHHPAPREAHTPTPIQEQWE